MKVIILTNEIFKRKTWNSTFVNRARTETTKIVRPYTNSVHNENFEEGSRIKE